MTDAKTPAPASRPRALLTKRRRLSPGDLVAMRRELWFAVRRVSVLLDDPAAEPGLVIKAANALALLANSYTRLTETAEIEAAIKAIRRDVDDIKRQRTGYPAGYRTA